ncbi:hypothetical protein M0R45_020294 [Rubus argutus]|uniref:Uncharacterized protein n=1 Tax=Rubus argutus TaxID=59490 RepID=A0AAW1X9L7_RUBAR
MIRLVDCVSLEVFTTFSNILEEKVAPIIKRIDLSNCYRLVDNLGIDVVSKMAKALLTQAVDGGLRRSLGCQIKLPSFSGWEVPKWFHYRKVDVCELLIEIPHNLLWGSIGLVVGIIFEITQAHSLSLPDIEVTLDGIPICSGSFIIFDPEVSGYHVCLKYIGLDNLWKQQVDKKSDQSLPHIFRAAFRVYPFADYSKPLLIKSCGLHLDNMVGNDDGDDAEEENYDDNRTYSRGENHAHVDAKHCRITFQNTGQAEIQTGSAHPEGKPTWISPESIRHHHFVSDDP